MSCSLCHGFSGSCCRRPIADFVNAKRQTADAFADAVCEAGLRLNSKAAATLVASRVLSLCESPERSLRALTWAAASLLAQQDSCWADDSQQPVGKVLMSTLDTKLALLLASAEDAARLPAVYGCINATIRYACVLDRCMPFHEFCVSYISKPSKWPVLVPESYKRAAAGSQNNQDMMYRSQQRTQESTITKKSTNKTC